MTGGSVASKPGPVGRPATPHGATSPPRGLSRAEAQARLARDGPNELPAPARVPAWRRLAAEMFHFFALLFWVAGALAFVAGMPQLGVAIFVVVVLNGLFSFFQEERAEHAAERLRDLLPRRVTVVRDGTPQEIPASEVVTGDTVELREGDRVSADLHLDQAHALAVDTSTLTGESVPARPGAGEQVHAGSFVVEGEATATVLATGLDTRLAWEGLPTGFANRWRFFNRQACPGCFDQYKNYVRYALGRTSHGSVTVRALS